jgi:alpha-1,3-glucan synthase
VIIGLQGVFLEFVLAVDICSAIIQIYLQKTAFMMLLKLLSLALLLVSTSRASYYDEAEVLWNLNANPDAETPLDYHIPDWPAGFQHQSSPENWRFPFYSFFLDRFVNGDPTNDNANGTAWEHDPLQTQLRHGGDVQGLVDSLDYLQGLGIRGIYIVGSAYINHPWEADSYSPMDHTILDHHFGTIKEWRAAIQAIHERGMYVIMENTMATMSDLIGFQGFMNSSAEFSFREHSVQYVSDDFYRDFKFSNDFEEECHYAFPRFWNQSGILMHDENTTSFKGCMDSEFDQFGDIGKSVILSSDYDKFINF